MARNSVKKVLADGTADVPLMQREDSAAEHIDSIRQLYVSCKGNRARVHEELKARGVEIPYPTLTGLCRRHAIGVTPKEPVGHYPFEPAEEMQHDTSSHPVTVAERLRRLQCAALWMGYSRSAYAQLYPTFNRFYCRIFLTDALTYFEGAARRCMVDNTSVIVAHGTGKEAVIAPEMEALGRHFGFRFEAHQPGDANRSAGVERLFHTIEHNFYPGRTFTSLKDLNEQLVAWCDQYNGRFRRHLSASPKELFAAEKPLLAPLPAYIPEVYQVHERTVDSEGYVSVHSNRYSVDSELIGRLLQVHESRDHIRIFKGHRLVCQHQRDEDGAGHRSTLPQHGRDGRFKRREKLPPCREEIQLRSTSDKLGQLVELLRREHRGQAGRYVRQLHRIWVDYPTEPLLEAVQCALHYGLTDLRRIERMTLQNIAGDFFRLPSTPDDDEDNDHDS